MASTDEVVAELLTRKPFAVLGYSADDAVWCPGCLRSAAGLSPGRVDTTGRPVLPLYARDRAVCEEACDNCQSPLYDLLAAGRGSPAPTPVTARLRVHGERAALDFDRVPPVEIRTTLKASGWRWDPRFRVWWSSDEVPRVPAGVVIQTDAAPKARPTRPIVHRRTSKTP
jgi:hypothetical protein